MKWALPCIKLIYPANNSSKIKGIRWMPFLLLKCGGFFKRFLNYFDLFRREHKWIQTAFHKAFFLHFHIQKDRR